MIHPMIEHNGKMVHTTDSTGKRIHRTNGGIKAFHDWFGEENTHVDSAGRPMVAYHGTNKAAARSINSGSFRRSKTGHVGPGVYLGVDREASEGYNDGAMMKVYAKGKYLSNHDWSQYVTKHGWHGAEKAAREDGYAGIKDSMHEDALCVWDANNIKSAEKNSGKFEHGGSLQESGIPSFKDFLNEETLDDEREYRNERESEKEKGHHTVSSALAATRALKNAHSAKLRGDTQRHTYWLKMAYQRLIKNRKKK